MQKNCTSNKTLYLQENCFDCARFSFVKKSKEKIFVAKKGEND